MTVVLAQVLNGLILGSILLLVSLGLTLIFGLAKVINIAHGALYSLGALLAVSLIGLGLPFLATLIIVPIIVGLLGILVDLAVVSRVRNRNDIDTLLLTFGLSWFIIGILYNLWGHNPRALPLPAVLEGPIDLFGYPYPVYRLWAAAFAIGVTVAVLVFIKRTAWGVCVRATNDLPEMASSLGINRQFMMSSVFGLGAGLAGLAGAIAAPIFTAYPNMGDHILIQSFLVVVLGGLGSVRGSIVGAYVVGLLTVLGEYLVGGALAVMALFVVVMIVLTVRPTGLLGEGRIG